MRIFKLLSFCFGLPWLRHGGSAAGYRWRSCQDEVRGLSYVVVQIRATRHDLAKLFRGHGLELLVGHLDHILELLSSTERRQLGLVQKVTPRVVSAISEECCARGLLTRPL